MITTEAELAALGMETARARLRAEQAMRLLEAAVVDAFDSDIQKTKIAILAQVERTTVDKWIAARDRRRAEEQS